LRRLNIDQGYLANARSDIYQVEFQFKQAGDSVPPNEATQRQRAYVSTLYAHGESAKHGHIQFIAVDPPSWFLNAGDASGKVYRGKISDVIKRVVDDYSDGITIEVGESRDSTHNRWWMMRQDPKTFILSMLDWASAVSAKKSQWIVEVDDRTMRVQEQADIQSQNMGLYTYNAERGKDSIVAWELLADNALSVVNSKLVTQGMSAVSGQYLDLIQDPMELATVAKDSTAPKERLKAKVGPNQSFTKPPDAKPEHATVVGWSSIPAIPEAYSAGDIGKPYSDYIDGRARTMFLNMAPMAMRAKFRVVGHGVYSSGRGLGSNTITVNWMDADQTPYFMAGNWIVTGFHHIARIGRLWITDLYCSRLDWDANATAVPK
jgi:hypothetical protein